VLFVSILAAGLFAFFIHLLFEGDLRWFLLYYFAHWNCLSFCSTARNNMDQFPVMAHDLVC
jgi:hypothetical protein